MKTDENGYERFDKYKNTRSNKGNADGDNDSVSDRREKALSCFCLPFTAGDTEEEEGNYRGGNGLVFGLLFFSLLAFIPLVLYIDRAKDTRDITDVVHVALSICLVVGILVFLIFFLQVFLILFGLRDKGFTFCCKVGKNAKNKHAHHDHWEHCRWGLLNAVFTLILGIPSLIRFVRSILEAKRSYPTADASANAVFEFLQFAFLLCFSINLVFHGKWKSFTKVLESRFSYLMYPVSVFCNISVCIKIFFYESGHAAGEGHKVSDGTLYYTKATDNILINPIVFATEEPEMHAEEHEDKFLTVWYTAVFEFSLFAIPLMKEILSKDTEDEEGRKFKFELDKCSRGYLSLIGGFALMAIIIILMAAYFHLCGDYDALGRRICLVLSMLLCLLLIGIGNFVLTRLRYKEGRTKYSAEEILLVMTAIVFIGFLLFGITPNIHPDMGASEWLELANLFATFATIIFQTAFIVHLNRAEIRSEVGMGYVLSICWFLAIMNLGFWIFSCIEKSKHCLSELYVLYYGAHDWVLITHTFFAIGIFYRFHSFMMLMEIANKHFNPCRSSRNQSETSVVNDDVDARSLQMQISVIETVDQSTSNESVG